MIISCKDENKVETITLKEKIWSRRRGEEEGEGKLLEKCHHILVQNILLDSQGLKKQSFLLLTIYHKIFFGVSFSMFTFFNLSMIYLLKQV